MSNKKILYVAITFDTDSDPASNLDQRDKKVLGWKSLKNLNLIRKTINNVEKKIKKTIPISWFVRCDNQIKYYHGDSCWLLKKYESFWKKEIKKKSELQWHAHLYKLVNNKWVFNDDLNKIEVELKNNFKNIKKYFTPNCIRIGEAYMNNKLMKIIKKIGLKADSSAIPGRKRDDKEKYFNWIGAPNTPYIPSSINYRRKNKTDKKSNFFEIPMNTILIKAPYDKKPIKRYINLSFWPNLVNKNLKEYFFKQKYLVSITHPYEVLSSFGNNKNNQLISFRLNSVIKNIENFIHLSKKLNYEIKFITISDMINELNENEF